MAKATVSATGEISIPREVRDRLSLKAGTEVVIEVQGEALVIKRVVPDFPDWRTMQGMSRGDESLTKALEEERAAENADYEARIKG